MGRPSIPRGVVQPMPVNRLSEGAEAPEAADDNFDEELAEEGAEAEHAEEAAGDAPASAEPATARPRPISFYVQRAVTRYLGPEIRDFSVACASGRVQPNDFLPDIVAKIKQVAENVVRHGAVNKVEEIEEIVPVPAATGFTRLSPDEVQKILDARKHGHSKRQISKTLKRPMTTIQNVLNREGDPAPKELLLKEAEIKKKTIAKLQKQIADLGM